MNRRRYLTVAVMATTPLLTGCSEGDEPSNPDGTTQQSTPLSQNPAESEKFDKHIRPHTSAAMDHFKDAVGLFQTGTAAFDSIEPTGIDHQVTETISKINSHLSKAKSRLGTANNADYSYLFNWYIFGMQEYRTWLKGYLPFLKRAANSYNAWMATHAVWPPQDYDDIRDEISEAYSARAIGDFPTGWEPPEDTAEQLDRFDLEEFQQLEAWAETLENSFSTLSEWGQAMYVTGNGLATLAEGFPWYLEAVTRYEDQRYEGGKNEVAGVAESALGKFEAALKYYEENQESIPSKYKETYTKYVCFAESMVDAANLRIEASNAAATGDMDTAQTKTSEAMSARNRCPIVTT